MSKVYIPFVMSGDSITVFSNGVHIFPSNHLFYSEICKAVKNGDAKGLEKLLTKKTYKEGIEVRDNEVLYNGEPLNTVAVKRLFEMKAAGFDVQPMIRFLENCQKNDHPKVVAKLYEFLETRGMPITEDGCFIAYKYTREDGWDRYTGRTYQYLPGKHLVANNIENRSTICDLSGEECSGEGMHVGNWEYSGGNDTVLYVKINPKDVLSVPVGCNAKKIRVWELDVLERVDGKKEEVVVSSEGKKIDYVVGQELDCHYKNGDGKIVNMTGTILNVGKMYLELTDYSYDGYEHDGKTRLKISNIQKVL